jgi:signal transduction histidine kinase
LEGKYESKTGMGLGITGTQRLMDRTEFETSKDIGTKVTIAKYLPFGVERAGIDAIKRIQIDLSKATSADPYREMQQQNHQLLSTMAALTEKKTELAAMNVVLTEERELHERFIATLTHDLRSPLTAAKMAAEIILRSKSLGEKEIDMANRVVMNIERTDLMIQDMLNVSSIKAGQGMPTTVASCNLSILIDQIIENYKPSHGDRIKKLNSNAKTQGFWDGDTLKRAIDNLINNAIKYGTRSRPIEIFLSNPNPSQISINVRNWGNVIPPEEQKYLFDQFKRSDSAKIGGQEGWGLGLALVKGVAEAHGGQSKVTSSTEHGTVFSIQIPMDSRRA